MVLVKNRVYTPRGIPRGLGMTNPKLKSGLLVVGGDEFYLLIL